MSNLAVDVNVSLVQMSCGECGVVFAVPGYFQRERKETGKGWYCPNGHCRVYRESDSDRLRRELEQAQKRNAQLAWQIASERVTAKKEQARIMKRANAGVCQHCHRTFYNVVRHMKTKHPKELK